MLMSMSQWPLTNINRISTVGSWKCLCSLCLSPSAVRDDGHHPNRLKMVLDVAAPPTSLPVLPSILLVALLQRHIDIIYFCRQSASHVVSFPVTFLL